MSSDDELDALSGSGLVAEKARRLAQLDDLRSAGRNPYPYRFDRTSTLAELRAAHGSLEPGTETDTPVAVAGRIMLANDKGKLKFFHIQDMTGRIQLMVSKADCPEPVWQLIEQLDLGDIVGVDGPLRRTRTGEITVFIQHLTILCKSLTQPPEKFHGVSDIELLLRHRHLDLIYTEGVLDRMILRTKLIDSVRSTLRARKFYETETPVLHAIAGGAAARPFITHHNALDIPLYLRIALELHLKRLMVGGIERVYEIGRVFRNEGLSTRHNTEFTMLELYEAFVDYHEMATLTEELVAHCALTATGSTQVVLEDGPLELAPPWRRVTMRDAIREHAGVDVNPGLPVEEVRAICDRFDIPHEPAWGSGKLMLEIYEKTTEHRLRGPVFVLDYPREVSPLARVHRDDPLLTERFEVIIGGRELANAFSELNDPIDQRERFEAQARLAAAGDDEAHGVDEDYLRAMEYGLPPTGGLGIGVDRLVMLLAGVSSIREVILFPQLRPETLGAADGVTGEVP